MKFCYKWHIFRRNFDIIDYIITSHLPPPFYLCFSELLRSSFCGGVRYTGILVSVSSMARTYVISKIVKKQNLKKGSILTSFSYSNFEKGPLTFAQKYLTMNLFIRKSRLSGSAVPCLNSSSLLYFIS